LSQITQGIRLATGMAILYGSGDPNNAQPDSAQQFLKDINQAGVGSLYLRQDAPDATHALYVCTTAGVPATPTTAAVLAVWTPK
jgi:hypothetical protein